MFILASFDKMVSVLSICVELKPGLRSAMQITRESFSKIISHLLKGYCKHYVLSDLTLDSRRYSCCWRVLILDRINYINSLFHIESNKSYKFYQPSKHFHIFVTNKHTKNYWHKPPFWLCQKTAWDRFADIPYHSQKTHYENMPFQIYWKFHHQKLNIFR